MLISLKRDLAATRRFYLRALEHGSRPTEVSTDRAPAYPRVLSDLTASAAQAQEYDRANTLVTDAIELTNRTETTLAKQRLLTVAATLPSTSKADTSGVLRDQIISTLRR